MNDYLPSLQTTIMPSATQNQDTQSSQQQARNHRNSYPNRQHRSPSRSRSQSPGHRCSRSPARCHLQGGYMRRDRSPTAEDRRPRPPSPRTDTGRNEENANKHEDDDELMSIADHNLDARSKTIIKACVKKIVEALSGNATAQEYFYLFPQCLLTDALPRTCKPLQAICHQGRWVGRLLGPTPRFDIVLHRGSRLAVTNLDLPTLDEDEANAILE